MVLDIGCGPGRFSRAFGIHRRVIYHGLDLSARMLRYASSRTWDIPTVLLEQKDCSHPDPKLNGQYDLVVLHWVLNTSERWFEIVEFARSCLRPGGAVVWFGEWSDLYSSINGYSAEDGIWGDFWRETYRQMGDEAVASLRERIGIRAEPEEQVTAFRQMGWNVQELHRHRAEWTVSRSIRWALKAVLERRSFSNMGKPIRRSCVSEASRFIRLAGNSAGFGTPLSFSAVPIVASPK